MECNCLWLFFCMTTCSWKKKSTIDYFELLSRFFLPKLKLLD